MQAVTISSQPFLFLQGDVQTANPDSVGGLSGSVDPNGVVSALFGTIYEQIVGTGPSATVTQWVNTSSPSPGTVWV